MKKLFAASCEEKTMRGKPSLKSFTSENVGVAKLPKGYLSPEGFLSGSLFHPSLISQMRIDSGTGINYAIRFTSPKQSLRTVTKSS